jgi:hypothetical protein
LRRQPDGSLLDLKIGEPTEKQQTALFGQVFYELNVKRGLLVATYHDESGRTDPLVIQYRWDTRDNGFQIVEAKTPLRYKASFDCEKAKTVVENAICYSSTAASSTWRFDQAYKTWLNDLNSPDSDTLYERAARLAAQAGRDLRCGAVVLQLICMLGKSFRTWDYRSLTVLPSLHPE